MPNVLVTIPHHARHVPEQVLAAMAFEGGADRWLDRLHDEADPYTDEIFDVPDATVVKATVSRFVVDLNRDRNDDGPNGVVKRTDFRGRPLYSPGQEPDAAEVEARLRKFYDPFESAVDAALDHADFFVDGHSMQPVGPALGPDAGKRRPPISVVIGGGIYDGAGHTSLPYEIARDVARLAAECFGVDRVTVNEPFDYGDIQRRLSDPARPNHRPGFLLEINRALYLRRNSRDVDVPIPGATETLRDAFTALLERVAPLMAEAREVHA
ncbi:MAG: N-formylglutamate amidohydrolase [Planctomycetota bacterium]